MNKTKSVAFALHCFVSLFCLLGTASSAVAQTGETNSEGKFSFRLKPEKETIMLGEPLFFSFEVTNLSGEKVCLGVGSDYRNEVGRPDSFKVSVKTHDGVEVPQPKVSWGGGFGGCASIEPAESYYVNLFLRHWATIERIGAYRINVSREMRFFTYEQSGSRDAKYSLQADVNAEFTVVAYDENKVGSVIHSLGSIMLDIGDPRAVESAQALASINDKRVITYFAEAVRKFGDSDFAFDQGEYSIGSRAIFVLGTYDDDRAIESLQAAIKSPTEKTRYNVASAFNRSPHRLATSLLMKMHNDSDANIRRIVAQGLTKIKTKESLAVLRKLLKDENEEVRNAARESLKEIEKH